MTAAVRSLRVLISAGPTREPIDPVRFLSNYSTGYMGTRLAREALARGHRVVLVSGPVTEVPPSNARVVMVETSNEMERALRVQARRADVVIMTAAVADFRPVRRTSVKLPRRALWRLALEATPDIVARLPRRAGQIIVGFALESDRVVPRAKKKLRAKRLDVLLAQRVHGATTPFGHQWVDAWLLQRGEAVQRLGRVSKARVARVLLDKIEGLWYGQRSRKGK